MVARGDVDVDAQDSDGVTPFALACRRRSLEAMRVLLEAGADVRQVFKTRRGMTTAAVLACFLRDEMMLKLVLEYGVSANDEVMKDRPGHRYILSEIAATGDVSTSSFTT
jgi:ankyrin repeat protein